MFCSLWFFIGDRISAKVNAYQLALILPTAPPGESALLFSSNRHELQIASLAPTRIANCKPGTNTNCKLQAWHKHELQIASLAPIRMRNLNGDDYR